MQFWEEYSVIKSIVNSTHNKANLYAVFGRRIGARWLATPVRRRVPDQVGGRVALVALSHGDARRVDIMARPDVAVLARTAAERRTASDLWVVE
jgi:hypothetical protein